MMFCNGPLFRTDAPRTKCFPSKEGKHLERGDVFYCWSILVSIACSYCWAGAKWLFISAVKSITPQPAQCNMGVIATISAPNSFKHFILNIDFMYLMYMCFTFLSTTLACGYAGKLSITVFCLVEIMPANLLKTFNKPLFSLILNIMKIQMLHSRNNICLCPDN